MTSSIELVLMKCLKCGAPLPAGEEEVAWACATCGQGQQLDEALSAGGDRGGLRPLTVNWAAARSGPGLTWRPFWVFTGQPRFTERETYGFGGKAEPDRLWQQPCRFYLAAFPVPLSQLEQLGADLTRQQVPLRAGPPQGTFADCTLLPEDARQAAEFVVLTIEADRKDKLKSVKFTLQLGEPELWLLPFSGEPALGTLALA